jgi:cytochrome b561
MPVSNSIVSSSKQWTYAKPAIALHWILALLLPAMVALGWYMMSIEDQPNSGWYFSLHKSIGITIFLLVLLRLIWRLTHTPHSLPSTVAQWQVTLSRWTQWLLYCCMFLMPLTGFTGAIYSKHGVSFFGLALPKVTPNHDLSELFFSAHGVIVWILIGLATLHIAGGLKHLLVDRDGVFQRMWPNFLTTSHDEPKQ